MDSNDINERLSALEDALPALIENDKKRKDTYIKILFVGFVSAIVFIIFYYLSYWRQD
jgi:hypothetical protein